MIKLLCIAVVLGGFANPLHAADNSPAKPSPLEGTWRWNFTMPDGAQATPQIKFKTDKKGVLTGTSSFRKGSETAVTNLAVSSDKVSFDVVRDYLGDKVMTHYAGTFRGDSLKGQITSKANGTEQVYDWDAYRISGLDGNWKWSVDFGSGRPVDFTVTLKQEGEKVTGKVKSAFGESDIHTGKFKDNRVSFETERKGSDGGKRITRYHGKLAGEKISGTTEANIGGQWRTNKWESVRAD